MDARAAWTPTNSAAMRMTQAAVISKIDAAVELGDLQAVSQWSYVLSTLTSCVASCGLL